MSVNCPASEKEGQTGKQDEDGWEVVSVLLLAQPQVRFIQAGKAGVPSRLISGTWSERAS